MSRMKNKLKLMDDRHCFVCGENNLYGLKLKFDLEGDVLKTRFKPDKRYQGYADIVHGGIIGLILDEMMVNLLWKLGMDVVTAEYTVRLKEPVFIDEELEFTSRKVDDKGRLITVEAQARKLDGTLVAVARGKCMRV